MRPLNVTYTNMLASESRDLIFVLGLHGFGLGNANDAQYIPLHFRLPFF